MSGRRKRRWESSWPDFDIPSVCPQCRAHHDAMAATTGQDGPSDGDVNMCVVCRGISVYDSSIPTKLRFPTDEELEAFSADPRLQELRAAMEIVDRMNPLKGDYFPE
jgi:hypothetical protein